METEMVEAKEANSELPQPLPVDSEHKSTEFRLFSLVNPHMRAFHLSWLCFVFARLAMGTACASLVLLASFVATQFWMNYVFSLT